jgi:phenylacetate-CoA ligase
MSAGILQQPCGRRGGRLPHDEPAWCAVASSRFGRGLMTTRMDQSGTPTTGDSGRRSRAVHGLAGAVPRLTAYQRFCYSVILPAGDWVLGQRVRRTFDELLEFQWWSLERIERFRTQRLRDLVQVSVERVPFYRAAFRERGISPGDIQGPSDLPRLPVLTKQHLRDHFDDLRVEGYRGKTTVMKSSGSTGAQTSVLIDRACNDEVFATQLLFWTWGGFAMGRPHLQTGMSLERGTTKRIKDLLFRCTYTSAFDLTDAAVESMLRQIEQRRIKALFGYASSLYVLAKYLDRKGLRRPMESIFTWGDSLFPHYRALIEQVFECPVNDCYGLGEGLQCAAQCEQHDALHEAMHGVIVEIVDHEGRPVPEGELGRVVVTRLTPGPMPLIRYDTGDVAHFVGGSCACGRALRRISRIQGRSTDIVTTPAGDRLIVHFFTQIFEMIPEIAQFQVRQERPDSITVRYVKGQGFEEKILDRIRTEILSNCRYPLEILFEAVEHIPLEQSNKRRFVISRVPF